jgi:uncharacterized protein YndB with AHSA1/START domain
MNENIFKSITVTVHVNANIEKVWESWTNPKHIVQWCSGSPDWHVPTAENDLREGGKFKTRMEAKDGSMGFDFEGIYTLVSKNKSIAYNMADGRSVKILFDTEGTNTNISETFDLENQNPEALQRTGWQTILNNFKSYTESMS